VNYEKKQKGPFYETPCRVFVAVYDEDFMILACTILIQSQSVMDGQAHTHTDAKAMAKKHKALCCRT